ncbi:MAG: M64 family metallopeptidase [Lewinella sp.]
MRTYLSIFLLFALSAGLAAQVTKIKDAGPDEKRINFVILGDGYTADQQDGFYDDANKITTDFFNEPPFLQYTNFFNVHTVEVISEESGADHPGTATDVTEPVFDVSNVNTALGARFDAGNIHRLLVVNNSLVFAELAANYPNYDQAVIVVNSPFYGGSGGSTAVGSAHSSASDLALHETGHSFMRLGDEYNSGNNSEWANITSQSNAGSTRWNDWVGINGVGEFTRNGSTFKPVDGQCMMEFLSRGFCSVCQEQTIETIYDEISPLESTTPSTTDVDYLGSALDFSITSIKPIPNTLSYTWELDGQEIATGVENVTISPAQITQDNHTLLVRVTDETTLSMKNANYVFTYEWTIINESLPLEWVSFTARAEDKINRLDWRIADPESSSHFLIERSSDGADWEGLNRVLFSGSETYVYYDELPLVGTNFYRIRAADFDGSLTDSPIRKVVNVVRNYFKVWPTVSSNEINVAVYSEQAAQQKVTVFAADGRLVLAQNKEVDAGWSQTSLDLSALASGSYTVRVVSGNEVHVQRVVKH